MSNRFPPVVAPCEITTANGTTLTGSCDLDLAWKWAEHENGETWAHLTRTQQVSSVANALHELRRAYHEAG